MKIKYFAWLRDKVGVDEEEITLPAEVQTVDGLINWLSHQGAHYEDAFEFVEVIKVVVNQVYVDSSQTIKDEDVIIFIPPIAGG